MGAFAGSIGVQRYRVRGGVPEDLRRLATAGMEMRAAMPIDPRSDEDRSHGWAHAEDPHYTAFPDDGHIVGDWLVATMRVDTLRIPRAQMLPILRERLQAHEAETGTPPDRRTRKRIELEVRRVLRHRVLPTVRAYDFAWHLPTGLVLSWATGATTAELFLDLFETTFDRALEPLGPAAVAAEAVEFAAALEVLRPTPEFLAGFTHHVANSIGVDGDLRTRTFLGREFLSWLLWRAECEGASVASSQRGRVAVRIGSRVTTTSLAGEVGSCPMRGMAPGGSLEARAALFRGGTVSQMAVALEAGAVGWEAVVSSGFDLRGVKLPDDDSEDLDGRIARRLDAIRELSELLDAAFVEFLRVRLGESWRENVANIGEWLREALERASAVPSI